MKKLKCQKCNYEWETKSQLLKVSCPSCGAKVVNKIEIFGENKR